MNELNKFAIWPEPYKPFLTSCGIEWTYNYFKNYDYQSIANTNRSVVTRAKNQNDDCGYLGNGLAADVMTVLLKDMARSHIPFGLIYEKNRPNLTYNVADFLREDNYYISAEESLSFKSENVCTFAEWILTARRIHKSTPTYPSFLTYQSIVYSVGNQSQLEHDSLFNYLDVFQAEIWLLLIAILILVRILKNIRVTISETRIIEINPAYFTMIAFLLAIINSLYRSSILSKILLQDTPAWILTVDDLTKHWKAGNAEFVINSGSPSTDILRHNEDWKYLIDETAPTALKTFEDMIEYVDQNPKQAFTVMAEMTANAEKLHRRNLRSLRVAELTKNPMVIYCTKGTSPSFMKLLNQIIVRNTEEINAVHSNYQSNMFEQGERRSRATYERYLQPIDLKHFIDSLVLLTIGTSAGIICFVIENLICICMKQLVHTN